MWCFIRLRRIFIMRIMYIFRADHRFMISSIRIRSVYKELHADHETGAADNK